MIPVRRIFGLEAYITDYHFENMSRFILLTSLIVGYAYGVEYFIAWYSGGRVRADRRSGMRAFGPYWFSTWMHDHLQRRDPAAALVQEAAHAHADRSSCSRTSSTSACGSSATSSSSRRSRASTIPAAWGLYTPSLVELIDPRRQLLLLQHVLPALPQDVPGDRDLRGEGARRSTRVTMAARTARTPTEVPTDGRARQRLTTTRRTSPTVVRKLKDRGFTDLDDLLAGAVQRASKTRWIRGPRKVRAFTLIGGLLGVVTGYAHADLDVDTTGRS